MKIRHEFREYRVWSDEVNQKCFLCIHSDCLIACSPFFWPLHFGVFNFWLNSKNHRMIFCFTFFFISFFFFVLIQFVLWLVLLWRLWWASNRAKFNTEYSSQCRTAAKSAVSLLPLARVVFNIYHNGLCASVLICRCRSRRHRHHRYCYGFFASTFRFVRTSFLAEHLLCWHTFSISTEKSSFLATVWCLARETMPSSQKAKVQKKKKEEIIYRLAHYRITQLN